VEIIAGAIILLVMIGVGVGLPILIIAALIKYLRARG